MPTLFKMDPRVAQLLRRPQFAQRTPEWYAARKECITASDAAAALRIKPYASYKGCPRQDLLQRKLENNFMTNIFVEHGQAYEDEARDRAMEQLGMTALDFGLLRHPDHPWLGASPDGITTCGTCIEIKCPLRRKIVPGHVPEHYAPQVSTHESYWNLAPLRVRSAQYRPARRCRARSRVNQLLDLRKLLISFFVARCLLFVLSFIKTIGPNR